MQKPGRNSRGEARRTWHRQNDQEAAYLELRCDLRQEAAPPLASAQLVMRAKLLHPEGRTASFLAIRSKARFMPLTDQSGQFLEPTHLIIGRKHATSLTDMAHYIVVVNGTERGQKVEIGLAPVRVGRGADNDLPLRDRFVSNHHCTVSFEDGQIWVTDTGSTNGSFIEGEQVRGKALWPISASLLIGEQTLRHEYHRRVEVEDADDLARELRQAAIYVQSLLPPLLSTSSITTSWEFHPCNELGGDIFDYFWLDSNYFVFYLLDVCGHGVGAALHSVSVFNLLRHRSLSGIDLASPARVMTALNEEVPMERYGSMYFTMWYGVYDRVKKSLAFASAGHPPAILFGGDDRRAFKLDTANPPIGVLEDTRFSEESIVIDSCSRLLLFSDGVYEFTTQDGTLWDLNNFTRYIEGTLGAGQEQLETIHRALRSMTKSNRFDDDFSMLLLTLGR